MSTGAVELVVGVLSALVVVALALGVALARLRERVARIEEWARLKEKGAP